MKLGFIVNPIAGMGGRVGLKGTDGVVKEAIAKGATPVSPGRAREFLEELKEYMTETPMNILTCPGIMGQEEAEAVSLPVQVLPVEIGEDTTAEDTKMAVELMLKEDIDLIIFVGGDGTARDIFDALQGCEKALVLGVPAGVKMYSGIFAVNPSDAVDVVLAYARGRAETTEFEIIDADEEAIRSDTFAIELHGYLEGPFLPRRIQGIKQVSPATVDEKENQTAIARFVTEEILPNATLILGPGTTVRRVTELLNVEKTLLGVDMYRDGQVILDVDEEEILEEVRNWERTWIVLSPIGRQGIILGRGNQQISPKIIENVGKQRIIIVATKSKLQSIDGGVLRVDTGDEQVDKMLSGYIRVVTDYREWRIMPVQ